MILDRVPKVGDVVRLARRIATGRDYATVCRVTTCRAWLSDGATVSRRRGGGWSVDYVSPEYVAALSAYLDAHSRWASTSSATGFEVFFSSSAATLTTQLLAKSGDERWAALVARISAVHTWLLTQPTPPQESDFPMEVQPQPAQPTQLNGKIP